MHANCMDSACVQTLQVFTPKQAAAKGGCNKMPAIKCLLMHLRGANSICGGVYVL